MKNKEINKLTDQWQIKWHHLQGLIDDAIKAKDFSGAYRRQCEASTLKRCIKDVYDIIKQQSD